MFNFFKKKNGSSSGIASHKHCALCEEVLTKDTLFESEIHEGKRYCAKCYEKVTFNTPNKIWYRALGCKECSNSYPCYNSYQFANRFVCCYECRDQLIQILTKDNEKNKQELRDTIEKENYFESDNIKLSASEKEKLIQFVKGKKED